MSRRLGLIDAGVLDARRWPELCARLLDEAKPRLVVARLSGAVASVGRWQRPASVLAAEGRAKGFVRRRTGGRSAALGEGLVAVALSLPHRSWLLSDDVAALPTSKLLNRSVRGMLAGLGSLGVAAHYFGRDYVSVDSAQAGLAGFEIAPSSAALVECVLAAETHWWLPESIDALPARPAVRGVPGPGHVKALEGRTSAEVLAAMAGGYASTFGLDTFDATLPPSSDVEVIEPEDLPLRSSLHPIPAGFVEAQAYVEQGRLMACRFLGDFNADSAGLEALQAALVGLPPTLDAVAPVMNDVYRDPAHTILGVRDLEVFATALLEACSR